MTTIYCDKEKLPARREHDFYPTDRLTVQASLRVYEQFLQEQADYSAHFPRPAYILDPGAGSGAWGHVARVLWPQSRIWGVEVRPSAAPASYDGWVQDDFLGANPWVDQLTGFDLVMGNPPYQDAEAFILRGLNRVKPGGHVLFLLRLAFLEGQKRRDGLFKIHPLRRVWVCSRRPSFTENGKSSPTAYALYLWQQGWEGPTQIDHLD